MAKDAEDGFDTEDGEDWMDPSEQMQQDNLILLSNTDGDGDDTDAKDNMSSSNGDGCLRRRSSDSVIKDMSLLSSDPHHLQQDRGSVSGLTSRRGSSYGVDRSGGAGSGDEEAKNMIVMKRDSLSRVSRVKPIIIETDADTDLRTILRRTALNHVKPNFLHSSLVMIACQRETLFGV